MSTRRIDRIWLIGGLALIAVIVVTAWFLPISSARADRDDWQTQAEDATTQLATLRSTLAELKKDNENLTTYQAQLETYQEALPSTNDIPSFLSQLQSMGTKLDIDVKIYSASTPTDSETLSTAQELPITLNATGDVDKLSTFVKQLQNSQPRAVLIQTAVLSTDTTAGAELALTLVVFITKSSTTTVTTQ
ncbi:type 4a pilus biogenesis protein PilO [Actinoplanes sp. NPDC051851]|uniref:type 4a pilus biogenesis protein PilO n=1 Tax=Actinoplanes sp. NPDC051851 TaxID=3154753 RepID=UPI003420B456